MAPHYNLKKELILNSNEEDDDNNYNTKENKISFLNIKLDHNILEIGFSIISFIPYVIILSLWWSLMMIIMASFTVNEIINYSHLIILRNCANIMEIINNNFIYLFMKDRTRIIYNNDNKTPYLTRFYLFIKHKKRTKFLFNIFFHKFNSSDDKKEMHDHPWRYFHIILSGGYWEHQFENDDESCIKTTRVWRGPGYWNLVDSHHRHRIELKPDITKCWTLFIPLRREFHWGFWSKKNGGSYEWFEKQYHEKYTEELECIENNEEKEKDK